MKDIKTLLCDSIIKNHAFNKYDKYDRIFYDYDSLKAFISKTYGFNIRFYKFMLLRFETLTNPSTAKFGRDLFITILTRAARSFISRRNTFNQIFLKNTVYLFKINSYRAWRQIRGLPSRGQRTWSNANTPYHNNVSLRNYIFDKSIYAYSGINNKISTVAFLAEYCNSVWKHQWIKEWSFFKKKKNKYKDKYGSMKVDLYSMSKFNVKVDKALRVLSKRKKKKQQQRKKSNENQNVFLSGFDFGFSKKLMNKSATLKKGYKVQLVFNKPVIKNKKQVKTKKKETQQKKKTKKSVWD